MNTFYINGDITNINFNLLKEGLIKRGWVEALNGAKSISFVFVLAFHKYNKQNVKTKLKNILEVGGIGDKWLLYERLQKAYPGNDFMPDTWLLTEDFQINNKIYITKPVISKKGIGIFVIKNQKNLENKIKIYQDPNRLFNRNKNKVYRDIYYQYKKDNRVVISEYLTDTLLFKKKKFHLRMYFMIGKVDNKFISFLFKNGRIMTAKDDFNINKVHLHSVYDTHLETTKTDYIFPEDLKKVDTDDIFNQMIIQLSLISNIFKEDINCYPESENCFAILGVDFMITKQSKVKLIEINPTNTGYGSKTKKIYNKFSKIIFDTILHDIVDPLFYGKKPVYKYVEKLI